MHKNDGPNIQKIVKINKNGGPSYRLLSVQSSLAHRQDDLDKYKALRIAIATPYGIIGTPLTIDPKKYSAQGHNVIKNKPRDYPSIIELIERYTATRSILVGTNALERKIEVDDIVVIDLSSIFKIDSKSVGLLIIIPNNKDPLDYEPLSCNSRFTSPKFKKSLEYLHKKNPDQFLQSLKDIEYQYNKSRPEREIYTMAVPLLKLGIDISHKKEGVDSPSSEIPFYNGRGKRNISVPIELKTNFNKFLADARDKKRGFDKYFHKIPLSVLCLEESRNWKMNSGVGQIHIGSLIDVCREITDTPSHFAI